LDSDPETERWRFFGIVRDRVFGYGWAFQPCWSSNSTRKPRLFDWTDDPQQATVDVAVYINVAAGVNAPGRKIAWLLESPEIARWQGTTRFLVRNLEKIVSSYEVVLTSDRELCKLHPKIVYHPAGSNLPYIPERQYAIYRKTKLCSMFASGKEMVPAHLYRRQVAERLQDKLDLFGGACGSPRIGGDAIHPDKSEGMIPYMFQVVIENAKANFYYTEKITDCFATGTVPIYWGSECIGELFDTGGIIPFDDDFDVGSLSEDLYYEMMPAIRNNFQRVQALEGSDDLLYRKYIRGPVAGEEIGPWKPGAIVPPRCDIASCSDATVPWQPWDRDRVLASTRSVPATGEERLQVVTAIEKRKVLTLAEVAPDRVTVREVTSAMQPLRSAASSEGMAWTPQLTTAFLLHLPDAFIGDGVVFDREHYYTMGRWWLGRNWRDYAGTREVRHLDAAVSVGAWGGDAFQHFVIDALPQLAAVIDLLETPEMAHVRIVSHNKSGRAAQWFWDRLKLSERIVSKPQNIRSGFVVHADLVLFPQFEPNIDQLGLYPRGVLRPIQRRLGSLEPTKRDLVVYLQRQGRRSVADEETLLSAVRRFLEGTDLALHVFPGATNPGAAVDLMKRARIVFGPHGGAFANLIFAQPGTQVIEFVPLSRLLCGNEDDPLSMYYGLAQAAGMNYWFVEPKYYDHQQPGMVIDVDGVLDTFDRILPRRR